MLGSSQSSVLQYELPTDLASPASRTASFSSRNTYQTGQAQSNILLEIQTWSPVPARCTHRGIPAETLSEGCLRVQVSDDAIFLRACHPKLVGTTSWQRADIDSGGRVPSWTGLSKSPISGSTYNNNNLQKKWVPAQTFTPSKDFKGDFCQEISMYFSSDMYKLPHLLDEDRFSCWEER